MSERAPQDQSAQESARLYEQHKGLAREQYGQEELALFHKGNILKAKVDRISGDTDYEGRVNYSENALQATERDAGLAKKAVESQLRVARKFADQNQAEQPPHVHRRRVVQSWAFPGVSGANPPRWRIAGQAMIIQRPVPAGG